MFNICLYFIKPKLFDKVNLALIIHSHCCECRVGNNFLLALFVLRHFEKMRERKREREKKERERE